MAIGYQKAIDALMGGIDLWSPIQIHAKAAERAIYALVSSGKTVSAPAYRKLLDDLEPVADGLFGAEMSQTFKWRGPDA